MKFKRIPWQMNVALMGLRTLDRTIPWVAAAWSTKMFLTPERFPRPPEEEAIWQKGKTLSLKSGRAMRLYGDGPRVVFLHGWESRGSAFFKWVEPLIQSGFEVILWDAPAHGDSPGTTADMPGVGRALLEDLRELPPKSLQSLIGHSFGGDAALYLQTSKVLSPKTTVIIGAPSHVEGVVQKTARRLGLKSRSVEHFQNLLVHKTGIELSEADFRQHGHKIAAKTLIIHDRDDKELSSQDGEELAAAIPGAELLLTEGLGHRRILRDDAVIQKVISFIR